MSKNSNYPIPSHLESPQCEQTKTKDYQGDGSLLQPDEKSKLDSSQLQAEPENNSKVKIKLNSDAKKTNVTADKVNEQELPRNRYSETYK